MEKTRQILVRRVDQIEGSPYARGRGRLRIIIGEEAIKKDLDVNDLCIDMIYGRTL